MARSVIDLPCYYNESGGDHFADPDYAQGCYDCSDSETGETCEERGCGCSCHYIIEPDEPDPEDDDI